jgi:hypothetical protein
MNRDFILFYMALLYGNYKITCICYFSLLDATANPVDQWS